ncbi:hypothetical protein CO038_03635 [Candidatus Pacearchaeota archaeon CG_4_9_14_0_2_um_filter_39_13]|nr:hypothetical protein [Candidatus Pacearchaeota archaeon]PJC44460.1 MAG: hypothetical protein CO038_03635 [Candidatus Pacearchaeota archaeon CG_4_9_14_0_2_um_filter_39_13]
MNIQILGFSFSKISAEKFDSNLPKGPKQRKITTNIKFTEIEKENFALINEETIRVSFNFSVVYEPKHAEITFNGTIMLRMDKEDSKRVMKEWKKRKILPEIQIPLFNIVLNKCTVRALQLEEELNLPTHMPLPRISKNQVQN